MSELYIGVKFHQIQLNRETVSHQLLPDLKKWCAIFSDYGFTPEYPGGSSGNLSFRTTIDKNGFIITGSYTKLGNTLSDNDFVEVCECIPEENLIKYKGKKSPSSESFMHYYIYKMRPDINAVFHGHSDQIMKIAGQEGFPETEKEFEYGTIELAESILSLIEKHNIVIIKNHGFISIGATCEQAGQCILEFIH